MGRLKNGPFSGFTGRTGSLVGTRKNGKWVMAAVVATAPKPPTLLQSYQRIKFGMVTGWLGLVSHILKLGFQAHSSTKTGFNAAVQWNLDHAVSGVAPNFTIDYTKAMFGRGGLAKGFNMALATTEDAQLDFSWAANIINGVGSGTDQAVFLVYNPAKQEFVVSPMGILRSALSYDMALPADFSGDNCYVWALFVSANEKRASDSEYLGATVIQ
ncbi:MAG: DUF6266 family protein [Bacteroidota bacterium]